MGWLSLLRTWLLTASHCALLTSHQLVAHALGHGTRASGLCRDGPHWSLEAATHGLFFPASAQCSSQPRKDEVGAIFLPEVLGGKISVRSTRDNVGSFPNVTCDDHYDGSQEQLPRRQNQIYCTGRGDGDLYSVFAGPQRGFAPIRKIMLTQGSRHILEV